MSVPSPYPRKAIELAHRLMDVTSDRALAAGCDDYLSKPFELETLLALIAQRWGVQYRYADDARMVTPHPCPPKP